ncbi:MAG: hypothetical protein C5B55_04605 [Blastocatellia bacterium]|nr:MAG: hypothetical protein C5B55_04605 [Blastocatellia bacterium]
MDTKFVPAVAAVRAGDLERFKALVTEDPSLATSRSSKSHPTLLQCVALDGKGRPGNVEMARVLVEAGAEINEPLIASASIDNRAVAELLLNCGAAINGTVDWSPIEEALYWNSRDVLALLLDRGAAVQNLRTAAGLGRTDLIEAYFNADGTLKPDAGKISWPWRGLETILQSNHNEEGKRKLAAVINSWSQDQQGIVNNAFVYACMHGHIEAAKLLLERDAEINVVPGGFDYAGTGLHYAALNGHGSMVEFLLENGANPKIKDTKVSATAAGWANHGGHPVVRDFLLSKEENS